MELQNIGYEALHLPKRMRAPLIQRLALKLKSLPQKRFAQKIIPMFPSSIFRYQSVTEINLIFAGFGGCLTLCAVFKSWKAVTWSGQCGFSCELFGVDMPWPISGEKLVTGAGFSSLVKCF